MNTISEATTGHLAFQKTQLLPLLTVEMISRRGEATARFGAQPHSESAPEKTRRHLPFKKTQFLPVLTPEIIAGWDGARRSPGPESTMEGAGQVLAAMIGLSANWAMFKVWGVRLLD